MKYKKTHRKPRTIGFAIFISMVIFCNVAVKANEVRYLAQLQLGQIKDKELKRPTVQSRLGDLLDGKGFPGTRRPENRNR